MKAPWHFTTKSRLNIYINLVIGILAVVSLLIIFHLITEKISHIEAVILSVAFTVCFIAGIFIGRYISYLWVNSHVYIRNGLLVFLPVLIFVMIFLANVVTDKIINSTNPYN